MNISFFEMKTISSPYCYITPAILYAEDDYETTAPNLTKDIDSMRAQDNCLKFINGISQFRTVFFQTFNFRTGHTQRVPLYFGSIQ